MMMESEDELESQGVELKKEFMQLDFKKNEFEWFLNMNFRAVTLALLYPLKTLNNL